MTVKKIKAVIWFKCFKTEEVLQGDSILLTTKSPGVSNTYLIDLGKMKDWVDLGMIKCCSRTRNKNKEQEARFKNKEQDSLNFLNFLNSKHPNIEFLTEN